LGEVDGTADISQRVRRQEESETAAKSGDVGVLTQCCFNGDVIQSAVRRWQKRLRRDLSRRHARNSIKFAGRHVQTARQERKKAKEADKQRGRERDREAERKRRRQPQRERERETAFLPANRRTGPDNAAHMPMPSVTRHLIDIQSLFENDLLNSRNVVAIRRVVELVVSHSDCRQPSNNERATEYRITNIRLQLDDSRK
jgi:hypothetical protein